MGPLFNKVGATSYVKILNARKAMANNQKEYRQEDTLTYKYMSDKDQKILKELPKMIKNLLPSKNSYPNLSITNMFISTSFRLQNETPGVGGHTPAQFVC